jgi:hypothetical protein
VAVFVGDDQLERVLNAFERSGAIVDRAAASRSVASEGFFVAVARSDRPAR